MPLSCSTVALSRVRHIAVQTSKGCNCLLFKWEVTAVWLHRDALWVPYDMTSVKLTGVVNLEVPLFRMTAEVHGHRTHRLAINKAVQLPDLWRPSFQYYPRGLLLVIRRARVAGCSTTTNTRPIYDQTLRRHFLVFLHRETSVPIIFYYAFLCEMLRAALCNAGLWITKPITFPRPRTTFWGARLFFNVGHTKIRILNTARIRSYEWVFKLLIRWRSTKIQCNHCTCISYRPMRCVLKFKLQNQCNAPRVTYTWT